jgi:hypothetical protein
MARSQKPQKIEDFLFREWLFRQRCQTHLNAIDQGGHPGSMDALKEYIQRPLTALVAVIIGRICAYV